MKITKNVGLTDRVIRLILGLIMLYFGFIDNTVINDQISSIILGGFGVIFFLTAIFSMCPLYNLIGLNTYKK